MVNDSDIKLEKKTSLPLYKKVLFTVSALFSVISVSLYFFDIKTVLYKNSILNLFLIIPVLLLIFETAKISDKGLHKKSLFSSFILSTALVIGKIIYKTDNLGYLFSSSKVYLYNITIFAGFFLFFYCVFKLSFHFLISHSLKIPDKNSWLYFGTNKRSLFLLWGIIFLCWIPCYLSYYPGIYSYDIDKQTLQALGLENLDQFQTTSHTLFFMFCIKIGNLFGSATAGLVTYSILQMLILSFCFAFAVWYMAKINIHYIIRIISLIYFAINPLNAIFSFVTTKDILFTGFFVLLAVLIIDVVKDSEKFFCSYLRQISLCLILVLCCLFRNNAVYAFILFFICFLVMKKQYYKEIISIFTMFITCFLLIVGPIFTEMGIKGGDAREALSIPMQQIANVVVHHEKNLTKNEKNEIAEILYYKEIKKSYHPRFADPIKCNFNTENFRKNKSKYIKLWLSLMAKHPDDYINSFLSLNIGYWYPDCNYKDSNSNRMYLETFIRDVKEFKLERHSKFPKLLKFYEDFAAEKNINKTPFLSLLFSIGIPIWFIFIGIMICVAKKTYKSILIYLPSVFLWLTFIAGPVSNLRYIYILMACYPVYLAVMLHSNLDHMKNNKIHTEK